tara:strand:+ start:245 stop:646 length:402 start_codon:yes stop_codon:yes gene_type:complete
MKLDILRKIIREEVKGAIKEELQEVLTEAVKVASTPKETPKPVVDFKKPKNGNLAEMINMTKESMTASDYKTMISADSSMVTGLPNTASTMATQMSMNAGGVTPGLDISKLDFVKKAKDVLDASDKIKSNKVL